MHHTIGSSSAGSRDGRISGALPSLYELIDIAPLPMWIADPEKHYLHSNQAWLDYSGQSIGDLWTNNIHGSDIVESLQAYTAALATQSPFRIECRMRNTADTYRWMLCYGSPHFTAQGTFVGYVGSCTDIQDVKQQNEIDTLKDEFISIASHQLRTPASTTKQYVGLLMQGYVGDLTDAQRKMITAAYESNQRQLHIIDDLLQVARVDSGKVVPLKQPHDMTQLVSDIVQEQQPRLFAHDQHLVFRHAPATITALIDQHLMRIAIENLIDNASKYSPGNENIVVQLASAADTITLQVKDHGKGIREQDQKRLFQKFSCITNSSSMGTDGSGLGLYLAKKVVCMHGGTITVDSKINRGSTFTVTLPASDASIL